MSDPEIERLRAQLAEAEARAAQPSSPMLVRVVKPTSFAEMSSKEQAAHVRGFPYLAIVVIVIIGLAWEGIASVFHHDSPPDVSSQCSAIRLMVAEGSNIDQLFTESLNMAVAVQHTTGELDSSVGDMEVAASKMQDLELSTAHLGPPTTFDPAELRADVAEWNASHARALAECQRLGN